MSTASLPQQVHAAEGNYAEQIREAARTLRATGNAIAEATAELQDAGAYVQQTVSAAQGVVRQILAGALACYGRAADDLLDVIAPATTVVALLGLPCDAPQCSPDASNAIDLGEEFPAPLAADATSSVSLPAGDDRKGGAPEEVATAANPPVQMDLTSRVQVYHCPNCDLLTAEPLDSGGELICPRCVMNHGDRVVLDPKAECTDAEPAPRPARKPRQFTAACIWCDQPIESHGPVGESSFDPTGRLCPGWTCQFYTRKARQRRNAKAT